MPQRRTAKKELRKNKVRHARNLKVVQGIKSTIKKFKKSLESADKSVRGATLSEVYKVLDRAASKNIIHHRTASRRKSRLTKMLTKAAANKTTLPKESQ